MSIFLEIEQEVLCPEGMEALLSRAAQAAGEMELGQTDAQACVLITDNAEIARLNGKFRGMPQPTDVLSFPANQLSGPVSGMEDFSELEMEEGRIVLGDIAISLDRAREQAEEYGHTLDRELAFLLIHGMLHIMGYDHIDPKEEEIMRERQRRILEKIGLSRD